MKRLNSIITIVTAGAVVFSMGSCKKGFLEGYDVDPNNPVAVSPDLILTTTEVATGYVYGSDYARYADMWTQHQAGTDRQFSAIGLYTILESDVDNIWRFNAYGGGMNDLNTLITEQTTAGNFAYVGIAQILMAANLGVLTDCFGAIPYSDAFQGADQIKPAYDSQESIYNSIFQLLSDAHANLAKESPFTPGDDDIYFGGDIAAWDAAASALEARYYLHIGSRDAANYDKALNAVDAAFADNSGDMQCPFGEDVTNNNLWYQFYDQRDGYLKMGAFFIDMLNSLSDPRLPEYADVNADDIYEGAAPGDAASSEFSDMGAFYASPSSAIPIITFAEVKFIEAEAAFRQGDKIRSADAFNAGVAASLDKVGVTDAAYLTANASETDATITLDKIMNQKYLAMFTQVESWTDYRRTGLPAITPASGTVPNRFPYPQSERLYNGDNVAAQGTITINTPMWWQ